MQTDLFTPPKHTMPEHKGSDFENGLDGERLKTQFQKIYDLMQDGIPRTLNEIELATGILAQASISAQLRLMRKIKYHTVIKKRRGEKNKGLFEYKLIRSIIFDYIQSHPSNVKEGESKEDCNHK